MNIKRKEITVRELAKGYVDNNEGGVIGYNGKLDIRPPYQREFIYKDKQRNAVIDTILNNYPLSIMYWSVQPNDKFEVIDGQQRTISICQYLNNKFIHNNLYFHNLKDDQKEKILNYKLTIYLCEGNESEKLEWFKTINIAGERLTHQELRNAVYCGSWVTDVKKYFSKTGCSAFKIAGDYLNGSPIRQDYLETAIDWISNGNIEDYMAKHQHDQNGSALWIYFQKVISWVSLTFTNKRKFMKGVNWGNLYNKYGDKLYDTEKIENETLKLILDDDVTKKSGIYDYILTRDENQLSIRTFTDAMKHKVYEIQNGICAKCSNHFDIEEMEADHITPWSKGGKTIEDNCQMLCQECNRRKSGI